MLINILITVISRGKSYFKKSNTVLIYSLHLNIASLIIQLYQEVLNLYQIIFYK